ncbi:MAG: hypothetical protein KJ060_05430 [Candidatus Hydrogenedentes bacterium]|nr:hypothetical protein [Candidatus Hydrogenedentota bacterium]
MIEFECPHCGYRLTVEAAHAGRHAWCRRCKRIAIVPAHLMAAVPAGARPIAEMPPASHFVSEPEAHRSPALPPAPAVPSKVDFLPREDAAQLNVQLVEKSATIERLTRELARAQSGLAQRDQELGQYREYADRAQQRIAELERGVSEGAAVSANRDAEMDALRQALRESERRVAALQSELQNAREVAATAERLAAEVKVIHGDAASKEKALQEFERAVDSRNAAIEESRRRIEDQADQLRALRTEADRARAELNGKTSELDQALGLIESLRQRESELQREVESLSDAARERNDLDRTSHDELETQKAKLARLELELEAANGIIDDKSMVIEQLAADLEAVRQSLRFADDEKARLNRESEDLRNAAERDRGRLESLQADLARMQAAATTVDLDALRAENASLRHEIERLRRNAAENVSYAPPVDEEEAPQGDDLLPDVVRPEEDDQRLLVDALLRFLGRK